ncbi:MAG: hypothetical protein DELT_02916 [Desulfovibrio sp.]
MADSAHERTRHGLRDTAVAALLGVCVLGAIFWFGIPRVPDAETLVQAVRERIGDDNPLALELVTVETSAWKRLDGERFEADAVLVFTVTEPIYAVPHMAGLYPYIDVWRQAEETLAKLLPLKGLPAEKERALRRAAPENPFATDMLALCRYAKGDLLRLPLFLRGVRDGKRITELNVSGLSAFSEIQRLHEETRHYTGVAATTDLVDVTTPQFAAKSRVFAEAVTLFAAEVAAAKSTYLSGLLGTALDPGTCYLQGEYGLLIKKHDFAKGMVQGREIFLDTKRQTAFTGRLVLKQDGGQHRPALIFTSAADQKERTVFIGEKVLYIRIEGEPRGIAFLAPSDEMNKVLRESGLGLDLPAVW